MVLVGLTGFGIFFIIELFHDLDVWLHACTWLVEEGEELCYAGLKISQFSF